MALGAFPYLQRGLGIVTYQRDEAGLIHHPSPSDMVITEWRKKSGTAENELINGTLAPTKDERESLRSGFLLVPWVRNLFGERGHGFSARDNILPCKNVGATTLNRNNLVEITDYNREEEYVSVRRPLRYSLHQTAIVFSDSIPWNGFGLIMLSGFYVLRVSDNTDLAIGRSVGTLANNVLGRLGGTGAGVVVGFTGSDALVDIRQQPLQIADLLNQISSTDSEEGGPNTSDILYGRDRTNQFTDAYRFGRRHDLFAVVPVDGDRYYKWALNISPSEDGLSKDGGLPTAIPRIAGQTNNAAAPIVQGGWTYDHGRALIGNIAQVVEHIQPNTAKISDLGGGADATAHHILGIRHDAQFNRQFGNGDQHGRIYFTETVTSSTASNEAEDTIYGDMVLDTALITTDTTLEHQTGEWRPRIKIPKTILEKSPPQSCGGIFDGPRNGGGEVREPITDTVDGKATGYRFPPNVVTGYTEVVEVNNLPLKQLPQGSSTTDQVNDGVTLHLNIIAPGYYYNGGDPGVWLGAFARILVDVKPVYSGLTNTNSIKNTTILSTEVYAFERIVDTGTDSIPAEFPYIMYTREFFFPYSVVFGATKLLVATYRLATGDSTNNLWIVGSQYELSTWSTGGGAMGGTTA